MPTFQEILSRLSAFWAEHGCIVHQGYDVEVGAGTFNVATFLRSLGPEPYRAAYIEPCRRPTDGRYGENPNRVQHYFQYQVVLKPSPLNIQDLYIESLKAIGFDLSKHDIRFVHDDWEAPTLGAWGLGWEVWIDGMEVTQFTYFQSVGGLPLKPVTGEVTYGLERLAMYLQKVDSIFDLQWNDDVTYGDIYQRSEVEWSHYNFEEASSDMWFRHFDDFEKEAKQLMAKNLPLPSYDFVMKASHAFNILDARGLISVTERVGYITRIRDLTCLIAESYLASREEQGFPLLEKMTSHKEELIEAESLTVAPFDAKEREDFILEVGCEELPATFVPIGTQNLKRAIEALLKSHSLAYKAVQLYGTPRRLAVMVTELAKGKEAQVKERKGPALSAAFADGKPSRAGEGFFRSVGISPAPELSAVQAGSVEGVEIRTIKEVDYLFASVRSEGESTREILAKALPKLILGLDFPKKMRWGDLDIAFARPLRWLLALHGSETIPFAIGTIHSGKESSGHRQLAAGRFELTKASDYVELLREHHIMVDIDERRKNIEDQLTKIEAEHGAKVLEKEKVMPQVLHLVEWPMLTVANFDEHFLKAPKEVLTSEMVEHQKYFPLADEKGQLINRFVITANNTPSDQIREGNEKVLSARLSDGTFLYEQDLKVSLDDLTEKLKHVTFQKELGSVHDKVKRLVAHAEELHRVITAANPNSSMGALETVKRAAWLCKADLASELVGEFPDLQGTAGRHYALHQGEDPQVAQAIDEHWMPRGDQAPLPESSAGIIISLSEKVDNLIGCFLVGLRPTSSSDPYALRRQVLGIIRMLITKELYLPLKETVLAACQRFDHEGGSSAEELWNDLQHFITNRIKTVFQEYGLGKDEIEASLSTGFEDIYETFQKIQALHRFRRGNEKYPLLHEVFRRARGQLDGQKQEEFSEQLLQEPAEITLNKDLTQLEKPFSAALETHNYDRAYELLASLQPALATLFDEVRVLADDEALKRNRIALLQRVFALFSRLLDFSKLQEGQGKATASKKKNVSTV